MARVTQTPIFGGAPRRVTTILGSGTYTVPDDISVIRIFCTAGGGGGGGHNTDDAQGGGGAGRLGRHRAQREHAAKVAGRPVLPGQLQEPR